jgi:hypothetical protein
MPDSDLSLKDRMAKKYDIAETKDAELLKILYEKHNLK